MTEDHKALIERLTRDFRWDRMSLFVRVKPADLDALLTLARRGAAAEGLVEALEWIAAGRPEFDSTHKANWARMEKASEALAKYIAATQSTESSASGRKVYLAARYSRHPEMREVRERLECMGYTVTSRWINGGHELTKEGSTEAHAAERVRYAQEDEADLRAADIVISFTEEPRKTTTRGGRHVEFGMALALGKPVYVVGWRENVFHTLPQCRFFATTDECLNALASTPGEAASVAGGPIKRCHANRDGDCTWAGCPQKRDREPNTSGRSCPCRIMTRKTKPRKERRHERIYL